MGMIRKTALFVVSSTSIIVAFAGNALMKGLDIAMTYLLISEHICLRCGIVDNGIMPNNPLCPRCHAEWEEGCDEECDDECEHPYAPKPIGPDELKIYR